MYKGIVKEEFISSNTFTYLQEIGIRQSADNASKIIKSSTPPVSIAEKAAQKQDEYHFIDTLAIIQDVAFKLEELKTVKLHWWNKIGIWLSNLKRS
jgi:hypothetical protein